MTTDMITAAQKGDLPTLKKVAWTQNEGDISTALKWAVKNGHADCAQYLITGVNACIPMGDILVNACQGNNNDCVKVLLPKVSVLGVDEDDADVVMKALTEHNNREGVEMMFNAKILTPYSRKIWLVNAALDTSLSVLQYLLTQLDPKEAFSEALRMAAQKQQIHAFDVLYPVSDPQAALEYMIDWGVGVENRTQWLRDRLKSEQEQHLLNQVLDICSVPIQKKKM